MYKKSCINNCKKCPAKVKEEQLELDFTAELPADVHLEFDFYSIPTVDYHADSRTSQQTSALNKIVSDLLDTVIMLNEEHGEELNHVLIEDEALHERLGKVEWLLSTSRQKRKVK